MKIFLFSLVFVLPLAAHAKLNVVATIPDLAAIAEEIGGDLVEVKSLCRGDQDPHYLEPKPSFIVAVNKADLLIEVGLELEIGWLPVLLTQSRNAEILRGQAGHLDASVGIPVLEIPSGKIDRSMGDIHPLGNPHYLLDPRNGLIVARQIAEKLSELDPANASGYTANGAAFESRLRQKIALWQRTAGPLRGRQIVSHHKSFSYLVNWLGIKVEGLIEPKPGIPPPPSHIHHLIQTITEKKISLIIAENFYDPKPAHELAKKTGATALILPGMVAGEAGIKTYADLFDFLIGKLKGAP